MWGHRLRRVAIFMVEFCGDSHTLTPRRLTMPGSTCQARHYIASQSGHASSATMCPLLLRCVRSNEQAQAHLPYCMSMRCPVVHACSPCITMRCMGYTYMHVHTVDHRYSQAAIRRPCAQISCDTVGRCKDILRYSGQMRRLPLKRRRWTVPKRLLRTVPCVVPCHVTV